MMLLEFLLLRAHKMYEVGFVHRKKLYDKHMLSYSSLCKNKEVLTRNGGGKLKLFISCVGSMSLLNMALVCIRVRLGTSHFVIFAFMGLGNLF